MNFNDIPMMGVRIGADPSDFFNTMGQLSQQASKAVNNTARVLQNGMAGAAKAMASNTSNAMNTAMQAATANAGSAARKASSVVQQAMSGISLKIPEPQLPSFNGLVTSASRAAQSALSVIDSTLSKAGSMGKIGSSAGSISSSIAGSFNKASVSVTSAIAGMSGEMEKAASVGDGLLKKVLAIGAGFVSIKAAGSIFSKAFDRVNAIDTATKSLTVLMGSTEDAAKVMGNLTDAIEGTPIALNDVALGVKKMVASGMGADKVTGVFKSIADAAYGVGDGAESIDPLINAFSKMQTASKLSLDPIRSLEDQGVPALKMLANQSGITADEMQKNISAGAVDSQEAISALVKGIQEGTTGINGSTAAMAGLAKTAGDTMGGALSNLRTSFVTTMAKGITPFKNVTVEAVTAVTNKIKDFRDNTIGAAAVQDKLAASAERMGKAFNDLLSGKQTPAELFKGFSEGAGWINTAITAIGGLGVISTVTPLFSKMTVGSTNATKAFGIMNSSFSGMGSTISKSVSSFTGVDTALAKVATGAINMGEVFATNGGKVGASFDRMGEGAGNAIRSIGKMVGGKYSDFSTLTKGFNAVGDASDRAVNLVQRNFGQAGTRIGDSLGKIAYESTRVFGHVAKVASTGFEVTQNVAGGFADGMIKTLASSGNAVMSFVNLAVSALGPAVLGAGILVGLGFLDKTFGDQITKIIQDVTTKAPGIIGGLTETITKSLPELMNAGSELLMSVLSGIESVLPSLLSSLGGVATQLVSGFVEKSPEIVKSVIGMINQIAASFAEFGPDLIAQGAQLVLNVGMGIAQGLPAFIGSIAKLVTGVLDNMKSMMPQIIGTVVSIVQALGQGIIDNLPAIVQSGAELLAALAAGISENMPMIVTTLQNVLATVITSLRDNLPSILESGMSIMLSLVDGIIAILPQLIEIAAIVLTTFVQTLADNSDKIVSAALLIGGVLVAALIEFGPDLIMAGAELVGNLAAGLIEAIPDILKAAGALIKALSKAIWEGIKSIGKNMWSGLTDALTSFGGKSVDVSANVTPMSAMAASPVDMFSVAQFGSRMSMDESNVGTNQRMMMNTSLPGQDSGGNTPSKALTDQRLKGDTIVVKNEIVGDKIQTIVNKRNADDDANGEFYAN